MGTALKWWLDEYPEPIDVELVRDSMSTPWGFRIAGGLDYGQTPIVVTQVNACSPASGQLCVGDIIISVDHQQVIRRRHFDVLSLLSKEAGGTLELQIYRGQTAEEIKSRSGFNIRFHAPLSYFPVTHTPQQDSSDMYRSVNAGQSGRPTTISLRRQQNPPPYQPSPSRPYFNPQQDEYMLHKVQQSLDMLTMGRTSRLGDYNNYDLQDADTCYVPVADKRRPFNQPDAATSPGSYLQQHQRQAGSNRPRVTYGTDYSRPSRAHSVGPGQRPARGPTPSSYSAFIRPRSSMGQPTSNPRTPEFCWMPRGFRPRRGMSQPSRPSYQQYQQLPPQYQQQQQQPEQYYQPPTMITPQPVEVLSPNSVRTVFSSQHDAEQDKNYVPPWKGTLHSASPSAWIEGALIDPNNPIYHRDHKRREPEPEADPVQVVETKESDDGRKIVHLQFNSPLQLYSKDAAKTALESQVASLGGPEGTIMIKGGRPGAPPHKITESSVYQMVHEEDARRQRRAQRGSASQQRHNASSSRPQRGSAPTPTASASGQLRVVLSQPPQQGQQNFYGGGQAPGGAHQHQSTSGFSDF